MSLDKPVTPVTASTSPNPVWIERQLSLATIRILRMQNIERMFGGIRRLGDRCGCQNVSRFAMPEENARLWCALVAAEKRGFVRQTSECELLKKAWLVWQPESVGFSWAEILEISNFDLLLDEGWSRAAASAMTLREWEELGRNEMKFRVFPSDDSGPDVIAEQMRISVIDDVLKRNSNFTHVNLMVQTSAGRAVEPSWREMFESRGLEVEPLRSRLLPNWQSGDMDIQTFTAYTIRRKDTRALASGQTNG